MFDRNANEEGAYPNLADRIAHEARKRELVPNVAAWNATYGRDTGHPTKEGSIAGLRAFATDTKRLLSDITHARKFTSEELHEHMDVHSQMIDLAQASVLAYQVHNDQKTADQFCRVLVELLGCDTILKG